MNEHYAVIGNPIAHSKSPEIHREFAASLGQTISYAQRLAPLDGFAESVRTFVAAGGKGANVTVPFKIEAVALATKKSENARRAGAANALKFEGDEIYAENFDGVGLVTDLQKNMGVVLKGKRILILGAGGAARGAILPLLDAQPDVVVVANRTLTTGLALAEQFFGYGNIEAAAPEGLRDRFDVVINSTSASLDGVCPEFAPKVLTADSVAYEMVYGKGLTPFLKVAQAAGVRTLADGVGMLVEQAAHAYHWWRGVRPQTGSVVAMMKVPLI